MRKKTVIIVAVLALLSVVAYGVWYFSFGEDIGSYTMAEVAGHNNEDDCWLVIDSNVYDVSGYLDDHPPGAESIIRNCGADATSGFQGVGAHGPEADVLLRGFLIGELSE